MTSRVGLRWVRSARMNAALTLFVALSALGLAGSAGAQQATIITFDVPASNGNGTSPTAMNLGGVIVGNYYDAYRVSHGFLRKPDGTFTTFDAPGAGTVPSDSNGTFPMGINLLGMVAGYYNDSNLVSHCFIRTPDGNVTTFDVPGADINPADAAGSIINGINASGFVVGYYLDTENVAHGFVRTPSGRFTSFDVPGSGGFGTFPWGTNVEGAVAGFYTDSKPLYHAFVRNPDGTFTTFSGPDSCDTSVYDGCNGTGAYGINDTGTTVGAYRDNSGNFVAHAFLRRRDGTLTSFEAPGAGDGTYQGTGAYSFLGTLPGLNNFGATASLFLDANDVFHGYVRSPDGTFATFDAPGADLTPGDYNGTVPVSINDLGIVTGFYLDSNSVPHGFVRIP
jgi:hypothetical protein